MARDALQFLLEDEGWAVEVAATSALLSSLVREALPDVLILGFRLPTDEAARIARDAHSLQPNLSVVVLSAADCPDLSLQDGRGGGRTEYLRKPIDFSDLLRAWSRSSLRKPERFAPPSLLTATVREARARFADIVSVAQFLRGYRGT